jgi:hypothetical protein
MNETRIETSGADKDQARIRGYQELLDFYLGKQWPGREKYGEKRLTFNYARIFIDKLTSYLMNGRNFTVESMLDTPEGNARAGQAEKALEVVHEYNHLEQLDYETETDCAILGDACYKVTWDEDRQNVRITAPDIRGISAVWAGDDMSRIWKVTSQYTLSAEEAEMIYHIKPWQKTAVLKEIWTESEFELLLDNMPLERKANPYGFIPFVIFPDLMRQNLQDYLLSGARSG